MERKTAKVPDEVRARIASNLVHYRRVSNMIQQQVSDETDYTVNFISLFENGHRGVGVGGLCELAALYGTTPGTIIDEER
jgi:transcriptional regulator with XRE-family HTH domain